jgi:MFS family permease
MKYLDKNYINISTILAFALLPLSGFATDIYLPSFPTMAKVFDTNEGGIQLTLVFFVISSGIGQLFAGSFVDRFGRYRIALWSLLIFAVSSFVIAISHNLHVVLVMRIIQGLTVALIVVSKRAFFMDVHSGEKLKHYTSLFAIIWATAPIAAPFIGGLLHTYFGWQSNFFFLGSVTLLLIALELRYSGETIREIYSLNVTSLLKTYRAKLSTADFAVSLIIVGLCFSNVMTYNLASPFIIEQVFGETAVITGNCSLLSGVAILAGGLISKAMIQKPIISKLQIAGPILLILPIILLATMEYVPSLQLMIVIVLVLHTVSGFIFNIFYAYAFGKFSTHAGIVSGLIGGGTFIITSIVTFVMSSLLVINTPFILGLAYGIIEVMITGLLITFVLLRSNELMRPARPVVSVVEIEKN